MLHRRLALGVSVLSLIAALALPGRAEQTFSTDTTGPLPSPGAMASGLYPFDLYYVYTPCLNHGEGNQCLCPPEAQAVATPQGGSGCRSPRGRRPLPRSSPYLPQPMAT